MRPLRPPPEGEVLPITDFDPSPWFANPKEVRRADRFQPLGHEQERGAPECRQQQHVDDVASPHDPAASSCSSARLRSRPPA